MAQLDLPFGEKLEGLLKTSRQATQDDRKLVESMERLLKNPDFTTYLRKVVDVRMELFVERISQPSESIDGMVKSEFLKGALFAFCLCRDLPSVIVTVARQQEIQDDDSST